MSTAALTGPGRWKLAELSRRTLVLGAITSLHILVVYLLPVGDPDYRRLRAEVTEAEIIPAEPSKPLPPPQPLPVDLQQSRPLEIPPLQFAIEAPAEPVAAVQSIQPREPPKTEAPVAVSTAPPPQTDSLPVVRPRPIAGPRGVDRYPNASMKARESGTVVMKICVNREGIVDRVELAHSSGFPRLDQAAMGMAAEYRFRPAMRAGRPIAACANYNIIFKVT